jgi:hypothetical protein
MREKEREEYVKYGSAVSPSKYKHTNRILKQKKNVKRTGF